MKALIFSIGIFLVSPLVVAAESDFWQIRPFAAVGFNSIQGTSIILGADLEFILDDEWKTGLTGHYSAGEKPGRDREYGAGPFVSYTQKLNDAIYGSIREEIGYEDIRNPILPDSVGHDYKSYSGIASMTAVGVTFFLSDNFAFALGYRFALGITNSHLGDGRSGPTIGLMVGI